MTPDLHRMVTAIIETAEGKGPSDPSSIPISSMSEIEKKYIEMVRNVANRGFNLGSWMPTLGKHLRALIPGEVLVVLASTGVGKSALLQNMALKSELPTLMLSLELPATLCFERFAANVSGISSREIERTYMNGETVNWQENEQMNNIFLCQEAGLTPETATGLILMAEKKIGVKPVLVIIDYIGLMDGRGKSRYERTSYVAEALKRIAKDTGTIVLAAAQVHRTHDVDDPTTEPVGLWDAKDSGSIENSAGIVLGAWRDPDFVGQNDGNHQLIIKVLKSTKGGAMQQVKARFHGPTMKIHEIDERLNEPEREVAKPYAE